MCLEKVPLSKALILFLRDDPITISDKDGTSDEGRVVKVRNNNIHVHFTDQSRWGLVQKGLEIPAPP